MFETHTYVGSVLHVLCYIYPLEFSSAVVFVVPTQGKLGFLCGSESGWFIEINFIVTTSLTF